MGAGGYEYKPFELDPGAADDYFGMYGGEPQAPTDLQTSMAPNPGLLSGLQSGSSAALPGAAAALFGLYEANKFGSGKKLNWGEKAALALPTGGLSLFSDQLQNHFGLGPRTTVESDKWKDLLSDQDLLKLVGPGAAQQLTTDVKEAPIRQDLPGGFVGFDPKSGAFVNNAFNNTRDEGLLKPEDLLLYNSVATAIDPKKYFGASHQNRLDLASAALGAGGVREHDGTVDLNDLSKQALVNKARELKLV